MAFIFVPYRGIYFLYRVYRHYDICSKHCPFSSPIGESTFSTSFYPICVESLLQFSSPIGESTFSTRNNKIQEKEENDFRPLSGNLLSLQNLSFEQVVERNFRPLSGNLLSLRSSIRVLTYGKIIIFVPYRGIYFLYGV